MMCQLCGKRTANVCINIDMNGTKSRRFICDQCADKRKLRENPSGAAILALINDIRAADPQAEQNNNRCCPSCGISYKDIVKSSKLGCADCYESFSDVLEPILNTVTMPPQDTQIIRIDHSTAPSRQEDIISLKKLLEQCVEREEYENAAKLRDRIAQLEAEEREVNEDV